MIDEIKTLLGDASGNYTDAQISLCLKQALAEVEAYTHRKLDYELEIVAEQMAIVKLNRLNTQGLSGQSYSGISETYLDGYPAEIMATLNRKRKIKLL